MSHSAWTFIVAMLLSAVVYGFGFWQGWIWGKRSGMADGIAWARERLHEYYDRYKYGQE